MGDGSEGVDALLAEGRRRYEAGDAAEAEPLARGALERLRDADPIARSVAVQLVGECAYALGRYREAGSRADEALRLRAEAGPAARAEAINLQGVVALALGDAERGHALVAEGLTLREASLGPDDPDTIESLNNTGVALARVGRTAEAIGVHEDALRRCERAFGEPHRQLAVTCNALAVKLDREDATRHRATELYHRGIEAGEAALGPEHPLVLTMLANLGTATVNAGDVATGRAMLERALLQHERHYGATHPNTATVLATTAALALRDGETALARERAERALRIRLDAFGGRDARTRSVLATLVRTHEALVREGHGDPAEAIGLLAAYRDLADGQPQDDVRFVRDPEAGERALRASLDRAAARAAPADPVAERLLARAAAAGLAADTALLNGDGDAAAVAAAARVELVEDALGSDSLRLVEPLLRLASVQRARGAEDEAIAAERRVHDVLAAAYGERHAFVLRARAMLVSRTARRHGLAAARPDLEALEAALASASPGGHAARLHERVRQQLEELAARDDRGDAARRGAEDDSTSSADAPASGDDDR